MDIFSIKGLTAIIKTGNSVSKLLKETIESIEAELRSLYLDIADSHFQAAKDSISSAAIGIDVNAGLRETITHLRAAYYIFQTSLDRKIKSKFFIFFTQDKPFLEYTDSVTVLKKQLEIGVLIMIIYDILGENDNKRLWINRLEDLAIIFINKKHDYLINRYKNGFSQDTIDSIRDKSEKKYIERHFIENKEKNYIDQFVKNDKDQYYTSESNNSQYYRMVGYKITKFGESYLKTLKQSELEYILNSLNNISKAE